MKTAVKSPTVSTQATQREELEKFFVAAQDYKKRTGKNACMPACSVDTEWHKMIKDEPMEYSLLCQRTFGRNVEHLSNNGTGVIAWVPDYEKKFGKLNKVWFENENGIFNEDLHTEYVKTGTLECAWDCSPG